MRTFQVGDTVTIANPNYTSYGQTGIVTGIHADQNTVMVRLDDEREYLYTYREISRDIASGTNG